MKLREQITYILDKSAGHMTAEEMYLYCVNHGIKASYASVYRVLGKLVEEGKIRKVSMPGQPDLFDKNIEEHEHLICIRCGEVQDIKIDGFRKNLKEKLNEEIDSYDLCIRYICPKCRKIK